ncbi:hypothetical protein [Nocardioides lijunqiniae]|uniref:hypothetical protein n=1 Tax=Nocardioides lijunqiniae TaxID=2760832 RepID=UPI0018777047|nr:hypothetical protein [Nocardioides lijunqiniae]
MTEPGQLRGHLIVLGVVVGAVVCWIWIVLSLVLGFGAAYGNDSDVPAVIGLAAAVLPVVVGIVLLVRPRTRQFGAGFLMGISIGFIAGAGVCAALFVPGAFGGI